jgi:hypothetical protein
MPRTGWSPVPCRKARIRRFIWQLIALAAKSRLRAAFHLSGRPHLCDLTNPTKRRVTCCGRFSALLTTTGQAISV